MTLEPVELLLDWNKSLIYNDYYAGPYKLRPEVQEWLYLHVGEGNFSWHEHFVRGTKTKRLNWYLKFWFFNPDHALLFKIRWSGK